MTRPERCRFWHQVSVRTGLLEIGSHCGSYWVVCASAFSGKEQRVEHLFREHLCDYLQNLGQVGKGGKDRLFKM